MIVVRLMHQKANWENPGENWTVIGITLIRENFISRAGLFNETEFM